jgi:SAM-dependent methyltransferase
VEDFYNKSYYYNKKNNKTKESKRKIKIHGVVVKLINKLKDKGAILDIGCGDGSLMAGIDKKRYTVAGTEYSTIEIARAKKVTSKIYKGDYLNYDAKDKYDIIIMTEVLEHTREPLKYLKKIHSDLKKEGNIIITVPNNDWVLMKGYKNNLVTNLHLFYFNQKTATNILKKAGFRDIHQIINFTNDYYENIFKTAIIQVTQIMSFVFFKISGINLGMNLIIYAKK